MYRIERVKADGKTQPVRKWRDADEARALAQRKANAERRRFIVLSKEGRVVYVATPR